MNPPTIGVGLINRGDGSYTVYRGPIVLGIVRKLHAHRWTCAPTGAGVDASIEVTEHATRRMAVHRLAKDAP